MLNLLLGRIPGWHHVEAPWRPPAGPEAEAAAWCRTNLPRDCLLSIPLTLFPFRPLAQRSIFMSPKDSIFGLDARLAHLWLERMGEQYPGKRTAEETLQMKEDMYPRMPLGDLRKFAGKWGITHVIFPREKTLPWPFLYANHKYVVYAMGE